MSKTSREDKIHEINKMFLQMTDEQREECIRLIAAFLHGEDSLQIAP